MKCSTVRHAGIQVTNMERSIMFYQNLGFKIVEIQTERWAGKRGPKKLQITKMAADDGSRIELVEGLWRYHICLEVDNVEAYPVAKETADCRVAFIEDLDGNRIELYQKKGENK